MMRFILGVVVGIVVEFIALLSYFTFGLFGLAIPMGLIVGVWAVVYLDHPRER